jgi:hypothetical protein
MISCPPMSVETRLSGGISPACSIAIHRYRH